MTYLAALLCVICIATGQILFKYSAISLQRTGSYFHPATASILLTAFSLYGLTSLGWIWVLRRSDLGRIYPLNALAFVLVPIASHLIFHERFSPSYLIGVALIVVGIVVIIRP